jgi:hypothetical protein
MAAPMPTVEKQEHQQILNSDGTAGGKWTVHLRHANGTKATVTLADEHYSAENVAAAAQHQANVVHAVGVIGQPVPGS